MDYYQESGALPIFRRNVYDDQKRVKLLDDLVDEAFFRRIVPISIGLSLATYFAIRKGYLKNNSNFSIVGKQVGCLVVGTVVGLYSFRGQYKKTIKKIDELRKAEDEDYINELYAQQDRILAKQKAIELDLRAMAIDKPNYLNLDTERPDFVGLDDYRNLKNDDKVKPKVEAVKFVTYEELRRKNRAEYAKNNGKYSLV